MSEPTLFFTLRLMPDTSAEGFLRECYDEWVKDAAYYRAHPEESYPPEYLNVPTFEAYVRDLAEGRIEEICGNVGVGFTVERVRCDCHLHEHQVCDICQGVDPANRPSDVER